MFYFFFQLILLELRDKFTLKLHSPDFEKHLLLHVSKAKIVISAEILNFLSTNVIFVEIKDSETDRVALSVLQHEVFNRPYYYKCPFRNLSNNCRFIGTKEELIPHCLKQHSSQIHQENSINIQFVKYNDFKLKTVIYTYENIFEFVAKYEETADNGFFTVRFYGDQSEAKEFRFTITVEQDEKQMAFTDVCKSIIGNNNGLLIPIKLLKGCVFDVIICITEK